MNKLKRVQIKSKTFIDKRYLDNFLFILQESMDNPWQIDSKILKIVVEIDNRICENDSNKGWNFT